RIAAGEVEEAVLLGEGGNLGLRILQDQPEAVVEPAGVGGQRLGAGVEDAALGGGTAHHGGVDGERAVLRLGCAAGQHHAVVEDVGAGAVLGGTGEAAEVGE